uniref:SMP-LTD domain-containing protein n=1 Tax=Aquila chrysaetos chrysaetos TaxID=223781 RepID=A0A663F773_AQUCH
MLLADLPRTPQPRLSPAKSRTAPSSPSISPSESRAALLRLREARLEDTKRRLSEAVQEPLSRLSRLMAEESGPTPRAKAGAGGQEAGGSPGQMGGRGAGGRRTRDWSPWEPILNCRYEICSYGDVIQVVEVAQRDAEPQLPPPEEPPPARPGGTVPGRALAFIALLAYGYFVLPLPPYAAGLCLGLICGLALGFLAVLLLVSKSPLVARGPRGHLRPKLLLGEPQETHRLQGWMNQLHVYDPELFHPSLTHSVLATLDGATLKLSYPKSNIPRRATFEEEILDATFVSHRCYNLTDAKVFLCPPSLARKRTWNKKYPICVLLPNPAEVECRSSEEHDTELQRDEGTKKALVLGHDVPGDCRERCLYLFGRTGREKEEWYQHLVQASRGTPSSSHGEARAGEKQPSQFQSCGLSPPSQHCSLSSQAVVEGSTHPAHPTAPGATSLQGLVASVPPQLSDDTARRSETCMAWMNALVGRIFWDFLREQYWAEQVSSKIQKKLSKIKLPYFMNELTLTELDMGTSIPLVLSASNPTINDRGLWVDMEVTYSGSLQMTLETKMNLCKLGKESAAEDSGLAEAAGEGPRLILLADSDAESSSAGSSDEEDVTVAEPAGALGERVPPPGTEGHVSGNSTSRKILRFVDKIAKSKYFQKATENEFIKKKIEEVSNTPLLLTVEVQELAGTLAVNVPPPPTDRVWYSFRVPPQLELKVRPKLGEREVTFLHVTEWIEKKLQHEFQKILVMPNMDDLIIPIMRPGLVPQPPTGGLPRDLPAKGEKRL